MTGKEKPLVSICIPAFNSENFIKYSIESALNQTWNNKEIIIVDDGSTDNTYSVIKTYESQNVKIFRQVNKGACAARNLAFKISTGDYIQWLDADDILSTDKVEKQMEYALKYNDPYIPYFGPYGVFTRNHSKSEFIPNNLWKDLNPFEWMITFLGEVLMTQPMAWLISRELSMITGKWNESLIRNQDGEYIFRLVSNSKFVKFTPEAKSYYRKGNIRSISKNFSDKAIDSVFSSLKNCFTILFNYKKDERSISAVKFALNVFINKNYYSQSHSVRQAIELLKELGENFDQPQETILFNFTRRFLGLKAALRLKRIWGVFKVKAGLDL